MLLQELLLVIASHFVPVPLSGQENLMGLRIGAQHRLGNISHLRLLAISGIIALLGNITPHAVTSSESAQNIVEQLSVQTMLGFSNTFQLGSWTPLTIVVTNNDSFFSGTLEVEVSHGDELEGTIFTTTYRRPLELTHNTRKTFHVFLLAKR